jgi:hypothetical protein
MKTGQRNEWNTGRSRVGDKGMKGIKERKKESEGLRYERNISPLNSNRNFTQDVLVCCNFEDYIRKIVLFFLLAWN